jgi:hypothetical protein
MPKAGYRKEVAFLYRRVTGIDLGRCAYCGFPRECLDHVPPLRLACDLDIGAFVKDGGRLLLYPSCFECNEFLGKKDLPAYGQRLSFLWERYGNLIRTQTWEQWELAELGPGLRPYITARQKANMRWIDKIRAVEQRLIELDKGAAESPDRGAEAGFDGSARQIRRVS